MGGLPLLSLTIFLPLIGAFFILFIKGDDFQGARNARAVGLLTTVATFISSCLLYWRFDAHVSGFQCQEVYGWLPQFNIQYHVGIDGVSLLLILLTTFLMPLALLSSWSSVTKKVRSYTLAFLLLETMIIGSFCALDLVLFYIFFEGVLIPMYLIIGVWGGERRIYASLKFFLYTFLGSVFMLVAIIVIHSVVGSTNLEQIYGFTFGREMQLWLWLAFFASFAVKVPMWPFHTWLPDAHVEAPTAGSVILAGVLLKLGGYGFLRFSLPLFPVACQYFAHFVFVLSVVAVVYTSLVALVQQDMKKLIAYSSVAHMGIVTAGIFTLSLEGVQGAVFQMISHGLVSAALFLCVGVLYDRLHTRDIQAYGGLVKVMPRYAAVFMILILASIGLPATSGFVGEILVLLAAFQISGFLAFGLGLGMILGAAYGLWLYRRVVLGVLSRSALKELLDLTIIEKTVLYPLVILAVLFGVYPMPILKISEGAMQNILKPYGVSKTMPISFVEKSL